MLRRLESFESNGTDRLSNKSSDFDFKGATRLDQRNAPLSISISCKLDGKLTKTGRIPEDTLLERGKCTWAVLTVGHIVCYQSKCLEKEKWAFGIVHARPGLIYGGGDVLEIHLKWLASIFIHLQCEISMADSPINWFNQVDCLSDKRIPMIFWRSLSAALLLSLPLKRTGKRFKFSFEFIDPDCRSMRILQS